ncbi:hypothetical protein [Pseudodesulfovibrio pelocollis]|uniref:hypothetical protein n=1 Tax=Pseudodesulfovibrio pelocollis TaxID=3051432 RepID=UPI00255B1B39|nr:hypothetical protein [Pseudodesulfovibrio sp. SB368]
MTTIPSINLIGQGVTGSEGKLRAEFFGPILNVLAELPGGAAVSALTIASGSITPTAAVHTVDTEGGAESDTLDNIVQTNHPAGRILVLACQDASRAVTLTHGAGGDGQMIMLDGADVTLDDIDDRMWFIRVGTLWREMVRTGPSFAPEPPNPNTLKSDTTATLTAGFTETPLAYTSGDISVSAGQFRTVDTTGGVTLGTITGEGRVMLELTGGGTVAYDAGYVAVGEYDATKEVCYVFATNSGAKKGLVFINSEA